MSSRDQEGHDFKMVAPPIQFNGQHNSPAGPCPEAGQHTEEVLLEYGVSWEDIEAGKESGAVQ
jgi:crotonobetainyl-CoA:carnitine CoA-transferase CaiB-like acyl-CoA transferase